MGHGRTQAKQGYSHLGYDPLGRNLSGSRRNIGLFLHRSYDNPYITVLPIILAVILLLAAGFGLSSRGGREAGVYSAALRATVTVIPNTAALSAIAIYVASTSIEEGYGVVIVGSSAALFVWTVVALFYRSSVAASSASLRNYSALSERLGQLESRFGHLHTEGSWQEGAREDGGSPHPSPRGGDHPASRLESANVRY